MADEEEANPLRDAVQSKQDTRATEGEADARKGASGENVRVNVRVPPDLHERFKQRAEREGRPISWLVRRFMEHYAAGGDVPPPPER
jgi:predicted DNA binding CopG/RHH family protein